MDGELFPVLVGKPTDRAENGEWPLGQDGRPLVGSWHVIINAKSWAIARYMAYAIAQRGIPTAWPKQDNTQDMPVETHWFTCSVQRAHEAGQAHMEMVVREAIGDRAIIASSEARSRSRVGNIIGELRGLVAMSENPEFAALINQGIMYLGGAMTKNIMPAQSVGYGFQWAKGHVDLMEECLEAWGVVGAEEGHPCPHCGEVHGEEGPHDLAQAITHGLGIDLEPVDPLEAMIVTHDPEVPQA